LVMEIPLELERRFERRWAARFSSRIVSAPHQPRRPEGLCQPLNDLDGTAKRLKAVIRNTLLGDAKQDD